MRDIVDRWHRIEYIYDLSVRLHICQANPWHRLMGKLSFGRESRVEKSAGEGNFKQFLRRNEVIALLVVERNVDDVDDGDENDGVGEDDGSAEKLIRRIMLRGRRE